MRVRPNVPRTHMSIKGGLLLCPQLGLGIALIIIATQQMHHAGPQSCIYGAANVEQVRAEAVACPRSSPHGKGGLWRNPNAVRAR